MLIILEGPDGAGKSTLAARISELTGAKLLHKGPPERDLISEYTLDLQWYRPGSGVDVVCDRWHLGEEVYGPLLRGEEGFPRPVFHHVEKTLEVRGALVGALNPPLKVLRERLESRGDELVKAEHLRPIYEGYRSAYRLSQLPKITLPDRQLDLDFAADLLIRSARHLEEIYTRVNPYLTYAGNAHPRWLLLGDERNRNSGEPPHDAAFTPAPATSGHYLLGSLPNSVLWGCGVANASEEPVEELWRILGKPATLALGRNSAQECLEAGIKFGVVPHPQFVRRFHHSAAAEYGALIRETLLSGEDQSGWRPSTLSTSRT